MLQWDACVSVLPRCCGKKSEYAPAPSRFPPPPPRSTASAWLYHCAPRICGFSAVVRVSFFPPTPAAFNRIESGVLCICFWFFETLFLSCHGGMLINTCHGEPLRMDWSGFDKLSFKNSSNPPPTLSQPTQRWSSVGNTRDPQVYLPAY